MDNDGATPAHDAAPAAKRQPEHWNQPAPNCLGCRAGTAPPFPRLRGETRAGWRRCETMAAGLDNNMSIVASIHFARDDLRAAVTSIICDYADHHHRRSCLRHPGRHARDSDTRFLAANRVSSRPGKPRRPSHVAPLNSRYDIHAASSILHVTRSIIHHISSRHQGTCPPFSPSLSRGATDRQ